MLNILAVNISRFTVAGNDTTTISHHPYILCHLAGLHKYALCLLVVCGEGLWKAVGCAEWEVSYVVGGCSVLATLRMAAVECMSSARSVWYVGV